MQILRELMSHRLAKTWSKDSGHLQLCRGPIHQPAVKPALLKQPLWGSVPGFSTGHVNEIIITTIEASIYERLLYVRHLLSALLASLNAHGNSELGVIIFLNLQIWSKVMQILSFHFKSSHLANMREGVEGLGQVPQTLGGTRDGGD